ncbi:hypothetical protein PHISP_08058 [Aspergillus sp. HF37]|nr:hypothetical protein PHISP_08058 [Aspergillus sp. HF37]
MAGNEGLTTDRRATGTENSDGNDALTDFCGGLYDATYPEDAVWMMPDVHLETTTETLLRYYFSRVCGILCAFDSCSNPLRSLVGHLIPSYPALLHSVLAMSAAHLHQRERDRTRFSLGHRTEAISKLAMHISEVTSTRTSAVAATPATSSTTALLLSAIMLGMTSVSYRLPMSGLHPLIKLRHGTMYHHWIFFIYKGPVLSLKITWSTPTRRLSARRALIPKPRFWSE